MTAPNWHRHTATSQSYIPDYIGAFSDDIDPGERIGAPVRRRRSKLLVLLVLLTLGGGAAMLVERIWPGWLGSEAPALVATLRDKAIVLIEDAKRAKIDAGPATASTNAPPAVVDPPPAPPVALPAEPQPLTTAALPPAAATYDAKAPSRSAEPSDPYRKRAEAVGLHPDLSRVVLAKLTDVDYRNAEIAIRTALAETADGGTFAWPLKPNASLAVFEVHFVPGGGEDCRRYVVAITKDGWSTTAQPMEKCGIPLKPSQRG